MFTASLISSLVFASLPESRHSQFSSGRMSSKPDAQLPHRVQRSHSILSTVLHAGSGAPHAQSQDVSVR